MNEIKLDDSLHKFEEKVEVKATWPSEYKTFITCFILEIADKKIAIDDSRIDVFNSVQDWKKSFSPWSNEGLYYIKESSILGLSFNIDDFFPGDTNYIFTVDDNMKQNYYEDFTTEECGGKIYTRDGEKNPTSVLDLIFSIAVADFEIISRANLCALNSLLYCRKEDEEISIMFEPIEDLPISDDILESWEVSDHNELWEVIDDMDITSIADAYFEQILTEKAEKKK